jgi:AhpD family alkylhydroperoxidase
MPETLLHRVPPESLPADIADMWRRSMDLRGDATFFEAFGNHPELFAWYIDSFYGGFFRSGRVEQKLKELLRLRLSTLHGCKFCNQGNRLDALAAGITAEQVESIEDPDSPAFNELEKATLRLADEICLTQPRGSLDESLYSDLKKHLDDAQIMELGMVAGLLTGMAKFMFVFNLVEREPTCPFPLHGTEHQKPVKPQGT